MIKPNNIEEIFKTNFSNAEAEPTVKNWSAIENALNDKSFESLYFNNFSTNTITPSSNVWKGIVGRLPNPFWALKTQFINIYSLTALISLIGVLSFVFLPPNKAIKKTGLEGNIVKEKEIIPNSKVENTSSILAIEHKLDAKMELKNSDNSFTKNANNRAIQKDTHSGNFNTPQSNFTSGLNTIPDILTSKKKKIAKKLENSQENNELALNMNSYPLEEEIYRDTLIVYDTISFYDTLMVIQNPIRPIKNKVWSLTPHLNLFSANSIHSSKDKNLTEYTQLLNTSNNKSLSFAAGIGAQFDYNKWRISSGLDYTVIEEEFIHQSRLVEVVQKEKFSLKENGFIEKIIEKVSLQYIPIQVFVFDTLSSSYTINRYDYVEYSIIDTLWSFEVDTTILPSIDTVRNIKYDTVRVITYDTAYYNSVDTNIYINYYQNINKYSYIDIPLTIGYAFEYKKCVFRPSAGILLGIMINAKGKGISMEDRNSVYNLNQSDLPFINFQVSMLLGLGIEYKIDKNLSLFIQPFYRRNLSSIYKKSVPIDKRFYGLGSSIGFSYYFN